MAAGTEVRKGSRPSGCPRPMRRSWLRRNRLVKPSHIPDRAWEGFLFRTEKTKSLHFFGEVPEQRPWATKREDRPAAFAGRSSCLPSLGYLACLHSRVSYPTTIPALDTPA